MNPNRLVPWALLPATVLLLTACGSTSQPYTTDKSAGQQLLELQEAHDKGLISDREFERMRRRIVREND